jgi:hypothetical protein
MKRIKIPIILVLFLAVSFAAAPSVMARGSEVIVDTVLNLDKKAAGTKLEGPMTLLYEVTDPAPPEGTPCYGDYETDMYMFLRLRKGQDFYGFAMGPVSGICHAKGITEQQTAVEDHFVLYIMPALFPDIDPTAFAFKSVDNIIDMEDPDSGILFTIMDIVIAVQD